MKPWDPVLLSGELPVAVPLRVTGLPEDDLEVQWWAHLLAALWGLRVVYHRLLLDRDQAARTGRIQERALVAIKREFKGQAVVIYRHALLASQGRLEVGSGGHDALDLETGWWAQAAGCAHALAAAYSFHGGPCDMRALLAADVLKAIRDRVMCALPPSVAEELLSAATAVEWNQARATGLAAGTPAVLNTKKINLESAHDEA